MPLLLCFSSVKTKLGQQVFTLAEPEAENRLSTLVHLQSNVALLFARDRTIQIEAKNRVLYILQTMPNAEHYLPNIEQICDIVPDSLCSMEQFSNQNWNGFEALYTLQFLQNLLETITNPASDPTERFTSLNQLNMALKDSMIAEKFCQSNGLKIVLSILDKSLRVKSFDSYCNNAEPIIGILSKLCIRYSRIRRQLAADMQIYVLSLRALVLFHHDTDEFKQDCSIVLFSMAFNDYIVGANTDGHFIVPPVCKRLFLPIKCEFRWQPKVKLEQYNPIEAILFNDNGDTIDHNANHSKITSNYQHWEKKLVWRFIRMNFAALWFDSLDKIPNIELRNRNNYTEKDFQLNYKTNSDTLGFSEALCLTSTDLQIVRSTSPQNGIGYWIKQFRNATTTATASLCIAALENFSNVDSNRKHWDFDLFLDGIKRFYLTLPLDGQNESLFRNITRLLINLVERDFIDVLLWALCELRMKNCLFLRLLTSTTTSELVYVCNVLFIESILAKTMQNQSKKLIEQLVMSTSQENASKSKNSRHNSDNLYGEILDIIVPLMSELLKNRKISKLPFGFSIKKKKKQFFKI